jgi:hypothetical protein
MRRQAARHRVRAGRSHGPCVGRARVDEIDTQAIKRIADVPVGELPWGVAIR